MSMMISSDLLDEIEDFLDDHADAEYIDGTPRGNRAMILLNELQNERAKQERSS